MSTPTAHDPEAQAAPVRTVALQRLGELGAAWDDLASAQELPSPFLRSWWLDHAAAGDPAIVVCREADGTLVGGAAFELDRLGRGPLSLQRVRCLGQGVLAPDHLDVIARPGRRQEVLGEVCRWLRRGNRVIDLDGLSERCELPHLLGAREQSSTLAPFVAFGEGDPFAALPSRVRSTIKRSARRLEREGFTTRRVSPADTARALDMLLSLHEARWNEASVFSQGWPRFRAAALAGAGTGEVVVHELADTNGTVIASELELLAGARASFCQAGRRTEHGYRGSGSVLKAEVIRWARDTGCTELDLLRGDEPYKRDWATGRREVVRARLGVGAVGAPIARSMHVWRRSAPTVVAALARLRGHPGTADG